MISTDEFLARVERVAADRVNEHNRHHELFKELQALAILTGCTVHQSGNDLMVNDLNGRLVMNGPFGDVVETLVAPPPDDGPFAIFTTVKPADPNLFAHAGAGAGFFSGLRLNVTHFPAEPEPDPEAPVHIDRRSFTLLSDLAECLSDYLDELA